MTRPTQGLLLFVFGVVLARIALSDLYLRYVTAWMKWPIALTGAVLVVLGLMLVDAGSRDRSHDHSHDHSDDTSHGRVPALTWLLLLPALMVFCVSPPELGAYVAERRAGGAVVAPAPDGANALGGDPDVTRSVDLTDFVWRAQHDDASLEGRSVSMRGFVSYDRAGNWYVTRLVIGCCAADAIAFQVRVTGAAAPPRDQWVEVTGEHRSGTAESPTVPPVLVAKDVREIAAPAQTYE